MAHGPAGCLDQHTSGRMLLFVAIDQAMMSAHYANPSLEVIELGFKA